MAGCPERWLGSMVASEKECPWFIIRCFKSIFSSLFPTNFSLNLMLTSHQAGLSALAYAITGHGCRANIASPPVVCVNPFSWVQYIDAVCGARQTVPEMFTDIREAAAEERGPSPSFGTAASGSSEAVKVESSTAVAAAAALVTMNRAEIQRQVDAALMEVLGSSLGPDQPLI